VTASVLVQVLPSAAETQEFLAVAASGTLVAGVVGWADLTAPDVADQIARLRGLPGGDRLAGLRHLVQDEPDPDWLDRPDVRRGLRALGGTGLAYVSTCRALRPAKCLASAHLTASRGRRRGHSCQSGLIPRTHDVRGRPG
jgi:predicted TIM-barrel fold metal-dependent hydrolase